VLAEGLAVRRDRAGRCVYQPQSAFVQAVRVQGRETEGVGVVRKPLGGQVHVIFEVVIDPDGVMPCRG